MKARSRFLPFCALTVPSPLSAEAAAGSGKSAFHADFPAFVDSLQYMLQGMAGVFLATGLIILMLLLLERLCKGKRD